MAFAQFKSFQFRIYLIIKRSLLTNAAMGDLDILPKYLKLLGLKKMLSPLRFKMLNV